MTHWRTTQKKEKKLKWIIKKNIILYIILEESLFRINASWEYLIPYIIKAAMATKKRELMYLIYLIILLGKLAKIIVTEYFNFYSFTFLRKKWYTLLTISLTISFRHLKYKVNILQVMMNTIYIVLTLTSVACCWLPEDRMSNILCKKCWTCSGMCKIVFLRFGYFSK